MNYLKIRNWDEFQHYKKRNPPWIKMHSSLLSSYEFSCLHDASKAHLLLIWLLAAKTNNQIPNDPAWIQKQIGSEEKPDVKLMIELGFIDLSAECVHNASKLLVLDRGETETETETEKHTSQKPLASDPEPVTKIVIPVSKIVELYHQTLCPPLPMVMKVTATRKGYIQQRWREDLPTLEHWENFFGFVKGSDFLMGKTASKDRRPFVASLEWLTKPANFAKISEDRYHGD